MGEIVERWVRTGTGPLWISFGVKPGRLRLPGPGQGLSFVLLIYVDGTDPVNTENIFKDRSERLSRTYSVGLDIGSMGECKDYEPI